jgi:hypothetical protein
MFSGVFKSGKGPANIMKMMLLSQMMGGNTSGQGGMMGNMGQMMAMSMMMGSDNPFSGLLGNLDLDLSADEDEEETDKGKGKSETEED